MTLEQRLERLERQNRHLRRAVIGVAAVGLSLLVMVQSLPPKMYDVVKAKKFEVVRDDGRVMVGIGSRPDSDTRLRTCGVGSLFRPTSSSGDAYRVKRGTGMRSIDGHSVAHDYVGESCERTVGPVSRWPGQGLDPVPRHRAGWSVRRVQRSVLLREGDLATGDRISCPASTTRRLERPVFELG